MNRRESRRPRPERQATVNRREGTRSRYRRCPNCKKLRTYWPMPNFYGPFRGWRPLKEGGPKVCHICISRSTPKGPS